MPQFECVITEESKTQIEEIARENGVSTNDVIQAIVDKHLLKSNQITRFVANFLAKKSPHRTK